MDIDDLEESNLAVLMRFEGWENLRKFFAEQRVKLMNQSPLNADEWAQVLSGKVHLESTLMTFDMLNGSYDEESTKCGVSPRGSAHSAALSIISALT